LISWSALIYFSFGVLTFLNTTHGADVADGAWLMAIVGTESSVLLGAVIVTTLSDLGPSVFVLIHLFWGLGLALTEFSSHFFLSHFLC